MTHEKSCICGQLKIEFYQSVAHQRCTPINQSDFDIGISDEEFVFLYNENVVGTTGKASCCTDTDNGLNRYSCDDCGSEVFSVSLMNSSIIGIAANNFAATLGSVLQTSYKSELH